MLCTCCLCAGGRARQAARLHRGRWRRRAILNDLPRAGLDHSVAANHSVTACCVPHIRVRPGARGRAEPAELCRLCWRFASCCPAWQPRPAEPAEPALFLAWAARGLPGGEPTAACPFFLRMQMLALSSLPLPSACHALRSDPPPPNSILSHLPVCLQPCCTRCRTNPAPSWLLT